MKALMFLVLVFGTSVAALAQPRLEKNSAFRVYLINGETRFERDASQGTVARSVYNLGLGLYRSDYSLIAEYASFKESTGNATSAIERHHRDYLLWLRYHLTHWGSPQDLHAHFYVGGGAGVYEEKIETFFMGQDRYDSSGTRWLLGVAAGVEGTYRFHSRISAVGAVEARTLSASDFDPNPMWGAALRMGLSFAF